MPVSRKYRQWSAHFRWFQAVFVCLGGFFLIGLSLTSGVQDASQEWRLRAVSVGAVVSNAPDGILRFAAILPFSGFAIAVLGVGMILSRGTIRLALRRSAQSVAGFATMLQICAYATASTWFEVENRRALSLCDYCSVPHPRLFEMPYLVTSLLLIAIFLALVFPER